MLKPFFPCPNDFPVVNISLLHIHTYIVCTQRCWAKPTRLFQLSISSLLFQLFTAVMDPRASQSQERQCCTQKCPPCSPVWLWGHQGPPQALPPALTPPAVWDKPCPPRWPRHTKLMAGRETQTSLSIPRSSAACCLPLHMFLQVMWLV